MTRLYVIVATLGVIAPQRLCARDRVVVQPPEKSSRLVLSGEITDYTAENIDVIPTVGGAAQQFPISQVLNVQTVQTEPHEEGVRHFRAGELDAARTQFETALTKEPRPWVRREILGWLVRIAMRQQDRVEAGQRFLQIVQEEPAAREWALAPLIWGTAQVDSRLSRQGRLWLTGASAHERLLGASVLLLDQQFGETAGDELNQLARVADWRIAKMAKTQLWRWRVVSQDMTDNEILSWEAAIGRMSPELRAGPYLVLGRAHRQRSDYDRAVAAFLWLPTVYHENEPLTAQATLDAATSLQRLGRTDDARRLLVEVNEDYGWSVVADEARGVLTEMNRSVP